MGKTRIPYVEAAPKGDLPLTQVELADIVRLHKPFSWPDTTPRSQGPFRYGIVAGVMAITPDGSTRNVSLYLFDVKRAEILMERCGIPTIVVFCCNEFEMYQRASERSF